MVVVVVGGGGVMGRGYVLGAGCVSGWGVWREDILEGGRSFKKGAREDCSDLQQGCGHQPSILIDINNLYNNRYNNMYNRPAVSA